MSNNYIPEDKQLGGQTGAEKRPEAKGVGREGQENEETWKSKKVGTDGEEGETNWNVVLVSGSGKAGYRLNHARG